MVMGFKYQLLASNTPSQLVDITMNHLSTIKEIVAGSASEAMVDHTIQQTLKVGRANSSQVL